MNDVLGSIGTVGLAVALTALLIFGTKGGGKLKSLGWWTTLILAMLAGSAYYAAGTPFTIVSDLVNALTGLAQGITPGITVAGLALLLAITIFFAKLSTRQVALLGIAFWYVASGAGGIWSTVAESIEGIAQRVV